MEEEAFAARCEDLVIACRVEDADQLRDIFYADNDLLEAWSDREHLDRVVALRASLANAPVARLVPDSRVSPHLMALFRYALVPLLVASDNAAEMECFFVSSLVDSVLERFDVMPDESDDALVSTQPQRLLVDRRVIVHEAVDALAGDDEATADRLLALLGDQWDETLFPWAEDEIALIILRAHVSSKRPRVE